MKHHLHYYLYLLLSISLLSATSAISAYTDDEIFDAQTIAVSPSGELVAAYWFDSISIFNLQSGERVHQFKAETDTPFILAFSPDSSKLISSGWNSTAVWNVQTGKLHASIKTAENSNCGGFSSNQKNVYFDDEYNDFGQRQLVLTTNSLKKKKRKIKNSARCNASPDQALLALQVHNFSKNLTLESSNLEIIDLDTLKTRSVLKGDAANSYDEDMFFYDDNSKLLVRDFSDFHLWNLTDGSVIRSWDSELDVDHVSVSGNRLLLTADRDVRIWDLLGEPSDTQNIPLPAHHESTLSVDLSNDGKLYAVTSYAENEAQSAISIIETDTNTVKHQFKIDSLVFVEEFTNNGSLLVLNGYPIRVIRVDSGEIIHEFTAPSEYQ